MTTTSQFQELPDFYKMKPVSPLPKPKNTNSRYPNFTQVHFTAGDIEQFETYRDPTNGENPTKVVTLEKNIWNDIEVGEQIDYEKYSQLTTQSVMNTFLYLFEKFKKGIFVKIKDNKVDVFLPFSKNNYVNEWGNRMRQPPPFRDMTSFLQYASKLQGYNVKSENINSITSKWYANNCLVRSEYPIGENDRCVSNLKDMLDTLCAEREVPDIELFFNRRDFPLIKRNNTEPYEHIFDDENFPLQSHRYDKYCPILSMVTTDTNADIPFPTMEDWARATSQSDNKFFSPDFKDYKHKFNLIWDSKVPTAVFRGTSTGCGVTVETNPRLKLAKMSITSPLEGGHKLLDAGITKWNCRPRKLYKNNFLQVIDPEKLQDIKLASFLDPVQQSNYKYIINVDGHVSAFRLSLELSMGSVVFLQKSKYRVWFRKYLVENVHYISIEEDLSDLYQKIRWCREHDDECRQIAENAKLFYDTYLSKESMLDFTQKLFCEIKQRTGTYFYNYIQVKDILYDKQLSHLEIKKDKDVSPFHYPVFAVDVNRLYTNVRYKLKLGIMNGFRLFLENHAFPSVSQKVTAKRFESKDTSIDFISIADQLKLCLKKSSRKYGIINEAFVGLHCTNLLLEEIPNFKYTYGMKDEKTIYTENVEGETFSQFIKSKMCTLQNFIGILQQLFLTLAVAQEKFGFVHHDLSPWNIIIKTLPSPQTIIYSFKDQVVSVETRLVPVIIDYDRSHFIYKNIHYGIISPFMTSTVQDCFSIVVHACYEFLTRQPHVSGFDTNALLYIINFLSNTEFHPYKIENIAQAKEFLSNVKKYNEMVYRNKCDLENLQPCDFFDYVEEKFPNLSTDMITIRNINGQKVVKECNYINPLFFYDMMIGKSFHTNLLSYLDKIEEQVKYKLETYSTRIVYYVYSMNKIERILQNVLLFITMFDTKDENHFIQDRNCKRILTSISTKMDYKEIERIMPECGHFIETNVRGAKGDIFCTICDKHVAKKEQSVVLSIGNMLQATTYFVLAKYTPETFSVRSSILTILQENNKLLNEKYCTVWYMIRELILYQYKFSLPNEREFQKTYGKLLHQLSPLAILNHNATFNTVREISNEIYKVDKEKMIELGTPPALRVLHTINHIQDLL